MNSFGAEILTCLAVMAVAAPAANDGPSPAVAPVQVAVPDAERSVAELIADLSNERFAVREAATKKLWESGDAAIGELKQAAAGADPEAAYRAREILRKIDLFITPGTDPAVINLVERYKKATASQKGDLLNAMREKRAYRQILKLYAAETDPKLRAELQSTVKGLAILAARESLLAGDAAGARALLEMAPADDQGLLALASFHRANGTLDAELERAKTSTAKGAQAWQLALYRAAGRLPEARAAAMEAGEPAIAAVMAMLAGDPEPCLTGDLLGGGGLTVDLYSPLALKRWQGKPLDQAALEPVVRLLNSRNVASRQRAFSMLFLLGEPAAAEPLLAKHSPLEAFAYFESEERIPEALAALALDPDQPDYTAWAAARFEQLTSEPDDSRTEIGELVGLASFLENRGLDQELATAFDKPLALLAAKNREAFNLLAGILCGSRFARMRVSGPLLRVGPEWAGDDEDRWEELLVAVFGDNDDIIPAWTWLSQLKPDATRTQRLQATFALAGFGADPANLREQWLDLAWANITKADAGQRPQLLRHLEFLVGQSADVSTLLKIHDLNPPAKEEIGKQVDVLLLNLSAAGRWQEAAEIILGLLENKEEPTANTRPDLHAWAAACLRRAGQEAQAAEHDTWVEKLALGDAAAYLRIGQAYAFGDDYDRCSRWWQRAACEVSPTSSQYDNILESYATDLLNAGKWAQAAAVSEVLAQVTSRSAYAGSSQTLMLRLRLQADLGHALSLLESDRPRALKMLENCHSVLRCDGLLADSFFPALRSAGLIEEHDKWFEVTWQRMEAVIKQFPGSHNTRNSAAWLAARAMRHLDEAEVHLKQALATLPRQAAYLDTMGEIQFARGRREEALEWSKKSINYLPSDTAIRRQYHRFASGPLPK